MTDAQDAFERLAEQALHTVPSEYIEVTLEDIDLVRDALGIPTSCPADCNCRR